MAGLRSTPGSGISSRVAAAAASGLIPLGPMANLRLAALPFAQPATEATPCIITRVTSQGALRWLRHGGNGDTG